MWRVCGVEVGRWMGCCCAAERGCMVVRVAVELLASLQDVANGEGIFFSYFDFYNGLI